MAGRLLVAVGASVLVLSAALGGSSPLVAAQLIPARVNPSAPGSGHVDLRGRTFVPGQVLVRFGAGQSDAAVARVIARLGGTTLRSFHIVSNLRLIALPSGMTVRQAVARYSAQPAVRYAEPNRVWHIDETIPNDPSFNLQWNWMNTGQLGGTVDADVDATDAWDLAKGSQSVAVGVIDTGVQYDHVDLAANMWHNQAECNGVPGVDDEGDGYVDDCYGIDTINHDSDPSDDFNHGTHVAGIIGAVGNNGVGVTGFNWNVTIVPCKSHDFTGNGSNASLLECLQFIQDWKDRGLNIVATNNSYGGCREACHFSQSLRNAIARQMDHGILFVASAGNDAADNDAVPKYPTDYFLPNVIGVAASNNDDGLAFFSNYGDRTVSVAAPGDTIFSTLFTNTYGYESGTSMASPHVVGLIALLSSYNPGWDWRTLRNLVIAGGDPNPATFGLTISGRRINALGSLTCSGTKVFGTLRPLDRTHTRPQGIAALNINCGNPAGALSVTITPGGQTINLVDDGTNGDLAADDGIYSGKWRACTAGNYTLTFSNGKTAQVKVEGNPC